MIEGQKAIAQFFRGTKADSVWYYRCAAMALLLLAFVRPSSAQSKSDATVLVSIHSRANTPIEPGFAGYNVGMIKFFPPVSFFLSSGENRGPQCPRRHI